MFCHLQIFRSGYISREEFRVSFAGMGISLTDEEFEAIDHTYAHRVGLLVFGAYGLNSRIFFIFSLGGK
jgi:vacuolar-type H+-ATPase subunit B/Vma2